MIYIKFQEVFSYICDSSCRHPSPAVALKVASTIQITSVSTYDQRGKRGKGRPRKGFAFAPQCPHARRYTAIETRMLTASGLFSDMTGLHGSISAAELSRYATDRRAKSLFNLAATRDLKTVYRPSIQP